MASSIYQQPMQAWPSLAENGKYTLLTELDLQLFYFEAGNQHQDKVLMIHGLGDEADTWRHIIHPMADQCHVIALDLPGFGRSGHPDVDYTPEFMINAIIGLMDQLDIENTFMIGSSLGGILAHEIALAYPDRLKGLILVGGALLQVEHMGDLGMHLMRLPGIGEWLYTRLRKDPDAAFASLKSVYHQLEALSEQDRDFLYMRVNQRVWSDGQRRAYFSTLRQFARCVKRIQEDLPEKLSQVEIPTLVLRGEYDALFPDVNAEAIINTQLRATKAIIKNAGHLPHQEAPENTFEIINKWIADNS